MKKIIYLTTFMFLISGCSITANTNQDELPLEETKEYYSQVETFKQIDINTLESKKETNDSFYVYIGRKSCPYCRVFVPKLKQASINTKTLIYYLDIENTIENSLEGEFMKQNRIETVPALLFLNEGTQDHLTINSEKITIDEIAAFLKK